MSDYLDIKVLFGRNVKKYRKILNISQEELGYRTNLHRTYISEIELGKRNVSLENINRLAIALNVPIYKLVNFEQ